MRNKEAKIIYWLTLLNYFQLLHGKINNSDYSEEEFVARRNQQCPEWSGAYFQVCNWKYQDYASVIDIGANIIIIGIFSEWWNQGVYIKFYTGAQRNTR